MNSLRSASFILVVSLISFCFSVDAWHTEVVTQVPPTSQITATALGITSTGMPVIAYCEHGSDFDYLHIARWTPSGWQFEQVNTSGRLGIHLEMALDSASQPCITCLDGSNNVVYVHKSGSTWQTQVVEAAGTPYPSIALDPQSRPHLAYFNQPQNELRYAWLNGSNWLIYTVSASISGYYASIDLDSNNLPSIAFVTPASIGDLKYTHFNGLSWNTEAVDLHDSSDYPHIPKLKLDSQNLPHIAYQYIYTTPTVLKYAHYDGLSWTITNLTYYYDNGDYPSLDVDSANHPYISHATDDLVDLRLLYEYFTGTSWQETTPCDILDSGFHSSISVRYPGYAAISHHTGSPDNRLLYTWFGNANIGVEVADFRAQTVDKGIKLDWDVPGDLLGDISGFNLYRLQAGKMDKKSWSRINSDLITGNNPYSYLDSSCKSGQRYLYRLTAIRSDGREEELGSTSGQAGILDRGFSLLAVYPNPTRSLLACRLSLPQAGFISIKLYDTSGRLVLAKQFDLPAGEQTASVDVNGLAGGIYCLQADSNGESQYKRIVMAR